MPEALFALGDHKRWRILAELSKGEPLMVVELAERLGAPPSTISRHCVILRKGGLVFTGRNGLYQIPPAFRGSPGERVIDYGFCVLRFAGAA